LGKLLDEVVFVGGSTLDLIVTDEAAAPIRGTVDVDVIAEITTYPDYVVFSERLRELGFSEDTFTGEHDVTLRLKQVLEKKGFRVAVMKASVPTEKREEWYADRSKEGVQVCICHPKLVETGLDLLEYPTIYFYETGYSLHTLRQASRRSWRIGQKRPVRVKFFYYADTAQEKCVRHMGKKMLVSCVFR
jgi:hypothetical protein